MEWDVNNCDVVSWSIKLGPMFDDLFANCLQLFIRIEIGDLQSDRCDYADIIKVKQINTKIANRLSS